MHIILENIYMHPVASVCMVICELGKRNVSINNEVSERKSGPFEHAQSMSKRPAGSVM